MQKVEGSSPFIRSPKPAGNGGFLFGEDALSCGDGSVRFWSGSSGDRGPCRPLQHVCHDRLLVHRVAAVASESEARIAVAHHRADGRDREAVLGQPDASGRVAERMPGEALVAPSIPAAVLSHIERSA
jgi:hypothetical protein